MTSLGLAPQTCRRCQREAWVGYLRYDDQGTPTDDCRLEDDRECRLTARALTAEARIATLEAALRDIEPVAFMGVMMATDDESQTAAFDRFQAILARCRAALDDKGGAS